MEYHYPVMIKEVSDYIQNLLNEKTLLDGEKVFVNIFDGTLGHAGHLIHLMKNFGDQIDNYVATDEDYNMFEIAQRRSQEELDSKLLTKVHLNNCTYTQFGNIAKKLGIKYDVIFLDLGVNLWHFKQFERGFSIKGEGDLDMRYNKNSKFKIQNSEFDETIGQELSAKNYTAADILNKYNELKLIDMFVINSEISLGTSKKLAAEIVSRRSKKSFETTTELNDLTKKLGYSARVAAIVFQALRIEVNQEFQNIRYVMEHCHEHMNPDGILIVLSYHSGEDRIIKEYMKTMQEQGIGNILTKHAVSPKYTEIQKNRPSRSAKMRVIKKY